MITEEIIIKTKKHVKNIMKLWKHLKLSVTPSAHLFEHDIIFQTKNIIVGLVNKTEDYIERSHEDVIIMSRRYTGVNNVRQSRIS